MPVQLLRCGDISRTFGSARDPVGRADAVLDGGAGGGPEAAVWRSAGVAATVPCAPKCPLRPQMPPAPEYLFGSGGLLL